MEFEFIQISTTCDDREILEKLAARLVESKVAACCQIEGPCDKRLSLGGQNRIGVGVSAAD